MDIVLIRGLATCFRGAIETAKSEGALYNTTLSDFPTACCGEASCILGEFLVNNGVKNLWYVCGNHYSYTGNKETGFYDIQSHAWLSIGDPFDTNSLVVDITADQKAFSGSAEYNYNYVRTFVGEKDGFYKLFEVDKRDCHAFRGLRDYDDDTYSQLSWLYNLIIKWL